jgi:hypothetical protein
MADNGIISILADTGPLMGAQLVERTGMNVFPLWQSCRKNHSIRLFSAARRFLRLDRTVAGYARLSPSIRREFLTYTHVGLDSQINALAAKTEAFRLETKQISQTKQEIARECVVSALELLNDRDRILEKACFLIAGDVVYDMSHTVPRPEKSTGEMVRGSDLDIVVVAEDGLNPEYVRAFDAAFHKRKHRLLVNDREEIDYLIKSMSRVREQLKFDIFSSMVACKILDESRLLHGNPAVFRAVKDMLVECRIPEKLKSLEEQAAASRDLAENQLLDVRAEGDQSEYYNLFYTHAEEDEIY